MDQKAVAVLQQLEQNDQMKSTPLDYDYLLSSFGQAVRKLRSDLGHSQEAFANICGIDRAYFGSIERGERNLTLINVFKIIEALGLKPSEFFINLD